MNSCIPFPGNIAELYNFILHRFLGLPLFRLQSYGVHSNTLLSHLSSLFSLMWPAYFISSFLMLYLMFLVPVSFLTLVRRLKSIFFSLAHHSLYSPRLAHIAKVSCFSDSRNFVRHNIDVFTAHTATRSAHRATVLASFAMHTAEPEWLRNRETSFVRSVITKQYNM